MSDVPANTPVTMPLVEPIVATDVLLLVHDTPPDVLFDSIVVLPSQTAAVPVMADGSGSTVIVFVL
jgi:hypothetical protein